MLKSIKKIVLVGCICGTLIFGYGCASNADGDYHMSNDKTWLTEQVEKGYITQAEADAILAKQEALKTK